jgi:hypothetical protein
MRPPERVRDRSASGKKYSDALERFLSLIRASGLADQRRSATLRRCSATAHSFL